jgi:SecD/SecF fusion protein
MKDNGFKIFAVVAFFLVSLYYLFPTVQAYRQQQRLAGMERAERETYLDEHYEEVVDTRERALNLGLDLQGGMHVTLEVGVDALLRELAEARADDVFARAIARARQESQRSRESFVTLFVRAIEAEQPGTRLSRYFRDRDAGITARSDNAEVANYLNTEAEEALDRAIEIIRKRVDRFGVTEPSIQKQGSSRVVVEMPGVDDPARVRELLRGTARLEFRLMADPTELQASSQRVFAYMAGQAEADSSAAAPADAPAAADTVAGEAVAARTDSGAAPAGTDSAAQSVTDLTTGRSTPTPAGVAGRRAFAEMARPAEGVAFAQVALSDTGAVRRALAAPAVRAMLPRDVELFYTARAEALTGEGEEPVFFLLGVRGRTELSGDVLTDAQPSFDPMTNEPKVSLTMNSEGAQRWSQITGANVGQQVAVVLDDVVYTYPVIRERIPGGRTEISGVSREEMEDIVTVLKSGALPAPVVIVQERTVGPSLGRESINAGALSLLVAYLLVGFFMVLFYRTAGVVACVSLALSMLFIFGILAAFGATLTLPGIAGLVLTVGMGVDANVLIYERIREELAAGKTLRAAIDGGFSKALSAIADGQITTFLIGVILYSFGSGPIQGFAVTLMAGILCSMFSGIVVTRLLIEALLGDGRRAISFG